MGAIGKQGSIAVVERFIKTLKLEGLRMLAVVPLLRRALQRELSLYGQWYNEARPHTTLAGATPEEVYFARRSTCRHRASSHVRAGRGLRHAHDRRSSSRASRASNSTCTSSSSPVVVICRA
jgi:hypothetical protein